MTQLKRVGPAFVLAAVVLGPGSLTLSTMAGSLYGYRLIWVPLIATAFMMAYTRMAARIGSVTGRTLMQSVREKHGPILAILGALSGFLAILAFQAGNSAAVGFSAEALFGVESRLGAVLFWGLALGMMLLPRLYVKLEVLVKTVVGLMLLTFAGTLLLVGVDTGQVLRGLAPSFPDPSSVFLALGMTGTTFSVAAAVYQSYLVREKNWGAGDLKTEGLDTILGIAVLGGISMVVLMTSASVLHGRGEVFSAETMALQLQPLAGPAAFYLFTWGFFLASLSSLVVNPLIGATLLVDGLGHRPALDSREVRIWAMAALTAGTVFVLVFRGAPLELLRTAQALAVVALPLLGLFVLSVASDRRLMKDHVVAGPLKLVAVVGYLTVLAIAFHYVRQVVATFWS